MRSLLRAAVVVACGCAPAAAPTVQTGAGPVESKLVAAYPQSRTPAVRARIVCKMGDDAPKKWSDVVITRAPSIDACEAVSRRECDGGGDVVRPCAFEPLPPPLVPRDVFVLREELADGDRYETFASAEECATALRERHGPKGIREKLDEHVRSQERIVDQANAELESAERRLDEARRAQSKDLPLVKLEVDALRDKRDTYATFLTELRRARDGAARGGGGGGGGGEAPIQCGRAGGS